MLKKYFSYFSMLMISFSLISQSGCSLFSTSNTFNLDDDKTLGEQVKGEIAKDPTKYPILDENKYPQAYQHIRRITNNILESGQVKYKSEFKWEVRIIHDDKTLNAFCTPGGYIYVFTGLIKFLESEDQIAGVMGHEIAHADYRHSTKQMTASQKTGLIAGLVAFVTYVFTGYDVSDLTGLAGTFLTLNYSREDETEADLASVKYLYSTEYDARGAARFFEKIIASGQQGGPEFLSTHPDPGNRVQKITDEWKKYGGKEGQVFKERYALFIKSLP